MPELPEVETVVRTLRPRLVGQTVRRVTLSRTDILTPPDFDLAKHLLGRTVRSIDRRGKRIVLTLDTGDRFYIHLGMTGQLTADVPTAPLKTHTHLILDTPAGQIRFRDPRRFGGIWWLGRDASPDARMGPEPLTLRPAQLATRLAKTKRAIKVALLDQQLVAGLGNIYVDEALFAAGLHPLLLASDLSLDQVKRLTRAIKLILRTAIRQRGSTLRDYMDADGASGAFQNRHKVYDRAGEPCRACKTPIERIVLGGRSTHFCPKCQRRG
jgi:formamidopyrimidine-DNA glycosylase